MTSRRARSASAVCSQVCVRLAPRSGSPTAVARAASSRAAGWRPFPRMRSFEIIRSARYARRRCRHHPSLIRRRCHCRSVARARAMSGHLGSRYRAALSPTALPLAVPCIRRVARAANRTLPSRAASSITTRWPSRRLASLASFGAVRASGSSSRCLTSTRVASRTRATASSEDRARGCACAGMG